jgi:hypothetical protein
VGPQMGVVGGRGGTLVQGVFGFVLGALFATLIVSRPAAVCTPCPGIASQISR